MSRFHCMYTAKSLDVSISLCLQLYVYTTLHFRVNAAICKDNESTFKCIIRECVYSELFGRTSVHPLEANLMLKNVSYGMDKLLVPKTIK